MKVFGSQAVEVFGNVYKSLEMTFLKYSFLCEVGCFPRSNHIIIVRPNPYLFYNSEPDCQALRSREERSCLCHLNLHSKAWTVSFLLLSLSQGPITYYKCTT